MHSPSKKSIKVRLSFLATDIICFSKRTEWAKLKKSFGSKNDPLTVCSCHKTEEEYFCTVHIIYY